MDTYLIIDIDHQKYLNYWSDKEGWTYYRELATEYGSPPNCLPVGVAPHLVKSEKLITKSN